MLIKHTHTYIEKLLIWQYVSLHTWLMNACTGVSFMKKRVWDTSETEMHLAAVGCEWATGSAAFVSGQQNPSLLPKITPVCFFFIFKSWFYGEREIVNRQRVWKRSFTRPLLVGDCWMSLWVDGRWCCDLRCHAPATFPPVWHPTLSHPWWPRCHVKFWLPISLHPSTSVSSPPEPGVVFTFLPDLFGKSSSSESLLKKRIIEK